MIDPHQWKQIDQIKIIDLDGSPLTRINELEVIRENPEGLSDDVDISNYVFANKWGSNFIYMIKISTGRVVASWDL